MPRARRPSPAPIRELVLERVPIRVPNRERGPVEPWAYRHRRLSPVGRPHDIYGDVIVSVARLVAKVRR